MLFNPLLPLNCR
jgi:ankyrin repeat protein